MVSFVPEQLRIEIAEAIKTLDFLDGEIEGIEFRCFDSPENSLDEYDCEINEKSKVNIDIGEVDYPSVLVKDFISITKSKENTIINEAQSYTRSDKDAFFLLEVSDCSTLERLDNSFKPEDVAQSVLDKNVEINETKYTVSLFHGFCIYHVLVEESGNYDKYYPSYSSYDYFIRVHTDEGKLNQKMADALASAYAFELQSTFDLLLPFSEGRHDFVNVDDSTESLIGCEAQMLPLIHGNGAAELLELYNAAKNTYDTDIKILEYTKVIEYIAPTIAQKELIEAVTLKLNTSSVFSPTAEYIFQLGLIFDEHKNTTTKDSELIKLSVTTAVTIDDIWDVLPKHIKGKQSKPDNSEDALKLMKRIADGIYSTRNEIAHAKANYEKRGTECPYKEKNEFSNMLEKIAIRCIRWFAIQPEEKRVVPCRGGHEA